MTLYLSRDLRTLTLPWLPRAHAPLILHAVLAGDQKSVPMYLHSPILHAALELHTDRLDAAYMAGQLTGDQMGVVKERLACVWRAANDPSGGMDWSAVSKARGVLAGRGDALAWVVSQYIHRMGGPAEVKELERLAHLNPWAWDDGMAEAMANKIEAKADTETETETEAAIEIEADAA